jgi:O-antigen/teichoic acid export membrane protein
MIRATAPGFVTHFLLLSMFKIRAVFIIDVLATIVKFGIGYALVVFGMGSFGIIVAFLGNIILTSLLSLLLVGNDLSFRLDLNLMRLFIAEGLVNTPSKISRILIFSLSIVLLASFGVNVSSIGIFYMALTMSLVVGGFATNIALMIIPSAAQSIKDYTSLGLRIGLSFTVPIIVLLTVGPELILGLIGYQYTVASLDLIILALAILPSSITITAISSLNTKDQHKKLLVIGIIEILSFILSFIILVPEKSTLGASLSTLIAFSVSATLSILWTGKPHLKYIMNSTIALAIGILFGYGLRSLFNDYGIYSVFNLFLPVIASTIVVFHLNEIKINEIIQIIKNVFNK